MSQNTSTNGLKPKLTPEQITAIEAENGLRQYDWAARFIGANLGKPFAMASNLLLELNRLAVRRLEQDAGKFRTTGLSITNTPHQPPIWTDVPSLTEQMCEYVTDNWGKHDALTLSAYTLWRINWIHPFSDGNGRTSRMASYIVLCLHVGTLLPGKNTVPEQIAANKSPYYKALQEADQAWSTGTMDVSVLKEMLERFLAKQLVSVLGAAGGNLRSTEKPTSPPPRRGLS